MKKLYLLLAILFVSVQLFAQTESTKKYITIELFSNTWCGSCAFWDPPAIATYQANQSDIHLLSMHPNVPYPQCPFYQASSTGAMARRAFYGNFTSTPRSFRNGTTQNTGGNMITQSDIDNNTGQMSPLRLKANITGAGSMKTVTVEAQSLGNLPGNYNLFVATVFEDVNFNAQNGLTEHHNVFWEYLTNANGDAFVPAPIGSSNTFTYMVNTSNIPHASWNANELRVIAFVQDANSDEIINSGHSDDIVVESSQLTNDCGNGSGSIGINISGGTGNYTIVWSNGMTNMTSINNLNAGTYMVTVSDGIEETYSEFVIENEASNPGANASTAACEGQDVVIDLFYLLGAGATAGGTWTDPNGNPNSGFYVNDSDPGGVYTYTVGTGACAASATVTVNYDQLPATPSILGLPTGPIGQSNPINMTGSPAGGTFSGPGVVFNAFNPSIAGPGVHTITYTVSGECGSSSTTQSVLVFSVTYNFVNYNLGTISPRSDEEIDVLGEVNDQTADNALQLLIDVEIDGTVQTEVYELSGRLLQNEQHDLQSGQQLLRLELPNIIPGSYYYVIRRNDTILKTGVFIK